MANVDNVIEAINCILSNDSCTHCEFDQAYCCVDAVLLAARELLNEQESQIDSLGADLTDSCDRVRRLRKELKEKQNQIYEMQDRTEYLEDKVKAQPQIVRCKDCKYSLSNSRFCAYPHKKNNIQPSDWFCADGERR